MTATWVIIMIIIFVIILLFAFGLCQMAEMTAPHSDCSYSDPDKRIGHDGDELEWKG